MTSLSSERVAFAKNRLSFVARERQLADFIAALGVRMPPPPAGTLAHLAAAHAQPPASHATPPHPPPHAETHLYAAHAAPGAAETRDALASLEAAGAALRPPHAASARLGPQHHTAQPPPSAAAPAPAAPWHRPAAQALLLRATQEAARSGAGGGRGEYAVPTAFVRIE